MSHLLLERRIFVTEQPVGCFVLLNGGEPAYRRVKMVVGIIIIALADFTQ